MRGFVRFFIGFVFVLIVLYSIFIGFIGYKATNKLMSEDWSGGLKPVIERAWCGEKGCLDKK